MKNEDYTKKVQKRVAERLLGYHHRANGLSSAACSVSMREDREDIWRKAVDYCLVVNCIGTTDKCETVHDALGKLAELIKWEVQIATDPAVNGGYELKKLHSQNSEDVDG